MVLNFASSPLTDLIQSSACLRASAASTALSAPNEESSFLVGFSAARTGLAHTTAMATAGNQRTMFTVIPLVGVEQRGTKLDDPHRGELTVRLGGKPDLA